MEVKKVLNNNVVIALHSELDEVILTGKGIGFGKKEGDPVDESGAEKFFVLKNEKEQEQYKQLLIEVDESFIGCMNDCMTMLENRFQVQLNEHIHVALTDHLYYAVHRIKQGMEIRNPFLQETELAYPAEYQAARDLLFHLETCTGISMPEGEIGFVALHIHTALTQRPLQELNEHTRLVSGLVERIEETLQVSMNTKNLDHQRLLRHLHQTLERIQKEDYGDEPDSLKNVLKYEYPLCYNLSWKLIKMMQQALKTPVPESEVVYLTLHLQRLSRKHK
ncbi:glucose PTS transporter transcription antiterminator GlcT [Salibacterium qingdaonense]|uniref:Transcriptional antiterminator, BglG family n=1 Tax=Salibacterium qingdaonense TaxID=266892 RepID=A0A1I4IJQ3_9BACI|nr:transcription antiterminator [Salibacterium qingdaonense]SFL54560.1 transcriptional antiterminator, BglG family [Salibacterium qingdaonense]